MTDRDKLIELLQNRAKGHYCLCGLFEWADDIADYLIANGVTVSTDGQEFCEFISEENNKK